MQRLIWATTIVEGNLRLVPHYDAVEVNRIVCPVFLQHPTDDCLFSR